MAKPKHEKHHKSIGEKIADVVDHVIHPDHKSEPEKVEDSPELEVKESSSASAGDDLSAHPKFAKFKTPRGEK